MDEMDARPDIHNQTSLYHLTLTLLVANLAIIKLCKRAWKMIETLQHGYSSKSAKQELSNEYQHDRV